LPVTQTINEPRPEAMTARPPTRRAAPFSSDQASVDQSFVQPLPENASAAQVEELSAQVASLHEQLAAQHARAAADDEANEVDAAHRASIDQAMNVLAQSQQQMVSGNTDGVADALAKASAVAGPNARADLAAAKDALDNEDTLRARGFMLQAIRDAQRER
jgi:hypothetical protein